MTDPTIATNKPIVIIESPFRHHHREGQKMNKAYLELCMLDSLARGEVPLATHKLYTQCLDDSKPAERALGMETVQSLHAIAETVVVYYDLGWSTGMVWGVRKAIEFGNEIEYRSLFQHPLRIPEILARDIANASLEPTI
jgi:hypothetical protein